MFDLINNFGFTKGLYLIATWESTSLISWQITLYSFIIPQI